MINDPDDQEVPSLTDLVLPGDQAEARGMIWSRERRVFDAARHNRLLVPEQWVEDAVRGALAEFQDDIVAAAKDELREKMEELKSQEGE